MSETSRKCSNCKAHDTVLTSDKTITTICRRNPPEVLSTFVPAGTGLQVVQANIWPQMKPDDWCGSFEPALH